jgi:hypothetical protein
MQSQFINNSSSNPINLDVKEQSFSDAQKAIPLAGKYEYPNGEKGNAIGEYLIPPSGGTFVLASVNGAIQWLATEDCN